MLTLGATSAFANKPADKCWCGFIESPQDANQQNTCHIDNTHGDQLCTDCLKSCKGGEKGPKSPTRDVHGIPGAKQAMD